MKFSIIICAAIIVNQISICQSVVIPGQEYTFEMDSVLFAYDDSSPDYSVGWLMSANLQVQIQEEIISFQLSDVSIAAHNGNNSKVDNATKIPMPPDAAALLKPFSVNYDGHMVTNLTVESSDVTWSINMKRALGSLFQLDTDAFHRPQKSFETTENNLYGTCKVLYVLSEHEDFYEVSKQVNPTKCTGETTWSWSKTKPYFSASFDDHDYSLSERVYKIQKSKDELSLTEINSNGRIYINPLVATGRPVVLTRTRLVLQSFCEIKKDLKLNDPIDIPYTYEVPDEDPTQGRSPPQNYQNELIKEVKDGLVALSKYVSKSPVNKTVNELHADYIQETVYMMQMLNASSLETLYNDIKHNTNENEALQRNFFLKFLALVGTKDSLNIIRDLVKSQEVEGFDAVTILYTFPFYLQDFRTELLEENKELLSLEGNFTTRVKQSAVLSFAHLVNKVCSENCKPDQLEYFTKYFFDKLLESTTHNEQILYLGALRNIVIGNVFHYLSQIVRGDVKSLSENVNNIRFIAATATTQFAVSHPNEMYKLYWPILMNPKEPLELRIIALNLLIKSGIDETKAMNLLWFVTKNKDLHLAKFLHSSMKSIVKSTHPNFGKLKKIASLLLRLTQNMPLQSSATAENIILDYTLNNGKINALFQGISIGYRNETQHHNIFIGSWEHQAMGLNSGKLTVMVKSQGLSRIPLIYNSGIEKDGGNIQKLLEELLIKQIDSDPMHLQLFIVLDGQVVFCEYFDKETLRSTLDEIFQEENPNPINFQEITIPWKFEKYQASDVGTIIFTGRSYLSTVSYNTNLTSPRKWVEKGSQKLELWYSEKVTSSVIPFNPVLNIWLYCGQSHVSEIHIPANYDYVLESDQMEASVHQNPDSKVSTVYHSLSYTHIDGYNVEELLKETCPDCTTLQYEPKGNNEQLLISVLPIALLGTEIRIYQFDCYEYVEDYDFWSTIEEVIDSIQVNSGSYEATEPLLYAAALNDYFSILPSTKKCGIKIEIAPSKDRPSEIKASFGARFVQRLYNGTKYLVNLGLKLSVDKEETPLYALNVKGIYQQINALTQHSLKLLFTQDYKNITQHTACLLMDAGIPPRKNKVLPLDIPNKQSDRELTFNFNILLGKSGLQTCPQSGPSIKLSIKGDLSEQQIATRRFVLPPYSYCLETDKEHQDLWGPGQTPITEECYEASKELGMLRKYTVNLSYHQIPKEVLNGLAKSLQSYFPTKQFISTENASVTVKMEVPTQSSAVEFSFGDWHYSMPNAREVVELFLFNRFTSMDEQIDLNEVCVLNGKSVKTFDNFEASVKLPKCYSLLAADCYKKSRFAVFFRQSAVDKKMDVKFIDGFGESLELLPTDGRKIELNRTDNIAADVIFDDNGAVKVHSLYSDVKLIFNGYFILIKLPTAYQTYTCGLCGNYNADLSDDHSKLLSLSCS